MTRTRSPVRMLQVGLGTWGLTWADVVRDVPEVEAAGWVDPDPAAIADPPEGLVTWPSLAQALERAAEETPAEAVLITAGLHAHAPVAKAALEAGLHVLVEKPFTPTLAEARVLVDLARRQERILMVSQNYRFHAAPRRVAQLLAEDRIGRLGTVRIDFRKMFPPPSDHPYRRGLQPLLLDMFVHHADLMRFLLGREPKTVSCTSWNVPWTTFEDPANAALEVDFGEGVVVSWRGSWESTSEPTLWAGDWVMEGERGAISWTSRGNDDEPVRDRVALRPHQGAAQQIQLTPPERMDRHGALTAFARAVRNGDEPETSGRDNLATLAICLAAIRSAAEGRRVAIDAIS